jgi:pantothenate kinase
MPDTSFPAPAEALARLDELARRGTRVLLGIAGAPGSGKSTLAEALHAARPTQTCLVPMDGFHLAQAELERLGRAQRKGAPDTFDAAGFVALLERLRAPRSGETVYAPVFRREIEEPVANAVPVPADVPVVIVEGNYLLLDEGPWAAVRSLLDEAWHVAVDPAVRVPRLIARHVAFGRSPDAAHEWVMRSDEANARRVDAVAHRADRIIRR